MRCLLLLVVLGWGSAWASDESVARDLARQLLPLVERGHLADGLWDGYRPSERSLGVYRPGHGVLVRHCADELPDGWILLSELIDRPDLGPCALFRSDTAGLGDASFQIERDLGSFRATLIRNGESMALLIHEDFHGFQRGWPERAGRSTLARLDESGDSAALRASLEREAALLDAALDEDDPEAVREYLGRWLALRLARDETQPERFVEIARGNEVIEGTAMWVGEKAEMLITDGSSYRRRLDPIRRQLGAERRSISNQMFFAYYFHGAVLSALVDGLAEDQQWQQRLVERESWPELVTDLLALDDEQLARLTEDERSSRAWRRSERAHGRALARFQREQERSATQYAWVLEFHLPVAERPEDRDTGHIEMISQSASSDEQNRLIVGHAERFEYRMGEIHIEIHDHPVILDLARQDPARTHSLVAVPLHRPLSAASLTRDGSTVELTRFSDRRAGIELRSDVPVAIRQVEIEQ